MKIKQLRKPAVRMCLFWRQSVELFFNLDRVIAAIPRAACPLGPDAVQMCGAQKQIFGAQ